MGWTCRICGNTANTGDVGSFCDGCHHPFDLVTREAADATCDEDVDGEEGDDDLWECPE